MIPEWFYNDSLSSSCQVCHWEVPDVEQWEKIQDEHEDDDTFWRCEWNTAFWKGRAPNTKSFFQALAHQHPGGQGSYYSLKTK